MQWNRSPFWRTLGRDDKGGRRRGTVKGRVVFTFLIVVINLIIKQGNERIMTTEAPFQKINRKS
jgi:hypothetical protein